MAVGGDGSEHGPAFDVERVEIDAVEVIARLFGRDGELRLFDETLQIRRGQRELVAEVAGGDVGKVTLRQTRQIEPRTPRTQRQLSGVARRLQRDLRALRQFAHDVIERMRRQRGRAGLGDLRRGLLGNLQIEIGGLERQRAVLGGQQHVRQDRNGRASLHHAVNMAERPQQRRSLNRDLHRRKIRILLRRGRPPRRGRRLWRGRTRSARAGDAPPGVRPRISAGRCAMASSQSI
ncbi:MAG: hypothetical protein FD148_3590 [Methylocystaceae bacterium]|nr:MAG: hypothetical protein FD148_3590 [Methylocystaceae bacterium]